MTLLLIALLLLPTGAVAALLCGRRSPLASALAVTCTIIAAALVIAAALPVLLSGNSLSWQGTWAVPGGALLLRLDPLAAFFVVPIALLSGLCAIYGAGYLREEGEHRPLAPHWFFFNLLAAALLLVVTAANAVLFLAAWEAMTLSSFFLVAWDHHNDTVRRAAWLYLLAAHCGLLALLALFIDAGQLCGSLDFAAFGPLAMLSPGHAAFLFALALFGFGVKAGLLPLHIWLPEAHPAAPSHVSALMSAVLVKTGLYGILRLLTLLPPAPAWWGWLLATLGITGALYGIALAGMQRDIKRCLAYSTIENVGIITLALGFALVAQADGHPRIALLAAAAALLHIWNHALFKGLMFLGAGALAHASGSRDINLMGGLLRRLPLAGLPLIGGSLAISALPPLNGLISEWLLYLSLLEAGSTLPGAAALPALLLIGALGMVGTLALLTFSRLCGIALLGEPRSAASAAAHEPGALLLLPPALLLAVCLGIGLWPGAVLVLLQTPLHALGFASDAADFKALPALGHWGGILLLTLLALAWLVRTLRRLRPLAMAGTWGCGYRFPSPRMAYTGDGFTEFAWQHLLPRQLRPQIRGGRVAGLFPVATELDQQSRDPILIGILQPLFSRLADFCQRLRWLQQGRLPVYLLYIFIASTALIVWTLWAGRGG